MGAAAGAMAGAAVDLFSAGLSLGTGMLIGAAAGGLWQGVEKLGKRVAGKLRGWREISVDDAVLRLLALRQRELIAALEHRGHAARTPIRIVPHDGEDLRKGALPAALKNAQPANGRRWARRMKTANAASSCCASWRARCPRTRPRPLDSRRPPGAQAPFMRPGKHVLSPIQTD